VYSKTTSSSANIILLLSVGAIYIVLAATEKNFKNLISMVKENKVR
jgi:hypothetical protein